MRLAEAEEFRQQMNALSAMLEEERERRKEATRAKLHAEGQAAEAVQAEQRRRLQLEAVEGGKAPHGDTTRLS